VLLLLLLRPAVLLLRGAVLDLVPEVLAGLQEKECKSVNVQGIRTWVAA
jgi:hypothetical protein